MQAVCSLWAVLLCWQGISVSGRDRESTCGYFQGILWLSAPPDCGSKAIMAICCSQQFLLKVNNLNLPKTGAPRPNYFRTIQGGYPVKACLVSSMLQGRMIRSFITLSLEEVVWSEWWTPTSGMQWRTKGVINRKKQRKDAKNQRIK